MLEADDIQLMRNGCRSIAQLLGILHRALEAERLPPAVVEHVLIQQYHAWVVGNPNEGLVDMLREMMSRHEEEDE